MTGVELPFPFQPFAKSSESESTAHIGKGKNVQEIFLLVILGVPNDNADNT